MTPSVYSRISVRRVASLNVGRIESDKNPVLKTAPMDERNTQLEATVPSNAMEVLLAQTHALFSGQLVHFPAALIGRGQRNAHLADISYPSTPVGSWNDYNTQIKSGLCRYPCIFSEILVETPLIHLEKPYSNNFMGRLRRQVMPAVTAEAAL